MKKFTDESTTRICVIVTVRNAFVLDDWVLGNLKLKPGILGMVIDLL